MSHQTEILRAARTLFAGVHGEPRGTFHVTLADETGNQVILSEADTSLTLDRLPALSPIEKEIAVALGSATLIGKAIAARLARPYDAMLRIMLKNLVDRGVLLKTPNGYRVKLNTSNTDH